MVAAPVQPCTAQSTAAVTASFNRDCEKLLIDALQAARREIFVAVYSFSRVSIADALIEKHRAGIDVRVKADRGQARTKWGRPIMKALKAADVPVEFIGVPRPGHMHHKFVVIDNQIVITGSYNFTNLASTGSWENLVRIDDHKVADQFRSEWLAVETRSESDTP